MKANKYILPIYLIVLLFSCSQSSSEMEFEKKLEIDNHQAILILNDHGYKEIPDEIGLINDLRKLSISKEAAKWVVYPPRSAWDEIHLPVKENKLTSEITKLKQLEVLNIGFLDLTALPDNFSELEQLDSLNLMMNYLNISEEMSKLKKLKNLRYVNILGNKIDTLMIKNWQAENPQLTIFYDWPNREE